jgi:hypothetical protein
LGPCHISRQGKASTKHGGVGKHNLQATSLRRAFGSQETRRCRAPQKGSTVVADLQVRTVCTTGSRSLGGPAADVSEGPGVAEDTQHCHVSCPKAGRGPHIMRCRCEGFIHVRTLTVPRGDLGTTSPDECYELPTPLEYHPMPSALDDTREGIGITRWQHRNASG